MEGAEELERAAEPFDTPLSALVTASQKEFVERAAARRQSSAGAIVRAAIEAYRRLHPTLDQ